MKRMSVVKPAPALARRMNAEHALPVDDGGVDRIAAELARLPGVARRLLVLHVPDEQARCRECTVPGTGLPGAAWPCALHFYAAAALRPTW